jgi:hypothetical protein
VPRHVGVGPWYEVFCDLLYCILISVFRLVLKNMESTKLHGMK